MSDRELLELAAKAAGYEAYFWSDNCALMCQKGRPLWNPLEDDGDAMRLAVLMDMIVSVNRVDEYTESSCGYSNSDLVKVKVKHDGDIYSATRRAITRAAAEIGRAMP